MQAQTEAYHLWLEDRGLSPADIRQPALRKLMHSGSARPKVLFVVATDSATDQKAIEGPERELLIKIIAALGLNGDEVHLATTPITTHDNQCYYTEGLQHLYRQLRPSFVICFGFTQIKILEESVPVKTFPPLTGLLISSEAKQAAWNELKQIITSLQESKP